MTHRKFTFQIKAAAIFMALLILSEVAMPTIALAVTSGPSQSEFNGFTSSDTSEMVDLSTGDFKYDIPLLTVPGPDGGYPLVLSYNAGVGMYDEASWVGLGWNLNAGVINRQMRGIPDDFNGKNADVIKKTNYIRDNTTVSLGVSSDLVQIIPELYGVDFGLLSQNFSFPLSYTMYYNTYSGLGTRMGVGAGVSTLMNEMGGINAAASFNLTFDSNEGSEIQSNISAGTMFMKYDQGFKYNARGGITSVNKGLTFSIPIIPRTLYRTGGNFATSTHVPEVSIPMIGVSAALNIDVEAGAFGSHLNIPLRLEGSFSTMAVKNLKRDFKAYGYMYGHLRPGETNENTLMDYNRDNDIPVNMKVPSLPAPILTNDIYTIKGVGGGGVFRTFRNDAGIYYTPDAFNRMGGATVGLEIAAAAGFKAAADISGFYSSSYTGKWRQDYGNLNAKMNFTTDVQPLTAGQLRTDEPFYFRMLGEKTPFENMALYSAFDHGAPSVIGIANTNALEEQLEPGSMPDYEGEYPFSGMQKFKTGILNKMNNKTIPKYQRSTSREKRTSLVEYRTVDEIKNAGTDYFKGKNWAQFATDVNMNTNFSYFNYTDAHLQNNHVGEYTVLQTDGSRYQYGIPVYNKSQKEAIFSCVPNGALVSPMADKDASPLINYTSGFVDNPTSNTSRDQYVSVNEISPYAHAYLLTNITSSDYIDLANDGPTNDDYGSYTKFNYQRTATDFKWRIPFTKDPNQAINIKGFLSAGYDNKASYTYGTKELWYLQSVETKTHIAFFLLSDREDGYQAAGEHGGRATSGARLKKLDKIILFSKKELERAAQAGTLPKALQAVDFSYSYDLCPNTPSNDTIVVPGAHPTIAGANADAKNGKLTLVKLTVTNESSSKGRLTPYVFEYGDVMNNTDGANPTYAYGSTDRWGVYRPNIQSGNRNEYNPYTNQDPNNKVVLDQQAGAWSLKKINTPSGGSIQIEYESDDYAYVQDRQAQQMVQILGTGKVDGSNNEFFGVSTTKVPIRENYRRIFFKPEIPLTGTDAEKKAAIMKYLYGLPEYKVYFKVSERLQIPKETSTSTSFVSDYVTGYATIETPAGSNYGYVNQGGVDIPYFTLKEVDQKGKNPLRVAGLQYLRYQRADLARTAPNGAQNAAQAILSSVPMFFSNMELLFGFYTWSIMKGHCEYLSNEMPSYVRLVSPDGIKYGGGHRVKKITVNDAWNTMTANAEAGASYEQNFSYVTENQGSSGVAAYEPQMGGDENAMKYPHYYDPDNKYIHNDPAFFIEDPLTESYFPAPQVVYSKVSVFSSATEAVKASGSGIAVHEFYTAKDYPTLSKSSDVMKTEDDQTAFIPFIAGIQFRNLGYSQGYSIEVNDMHGKPRASYRYDSDNWDNQKNHVVDVNQYLSYKKYVYNTVGDFRNGVPNALAWSTNYPILGNDSPFPDKGALGMDFEMFGELRESSDFSFSGGMQINGGVDPAPWAIFISLMPYFEYAETGARTVVTNKITYRTGILTEVISYNEGNVERTKHLMFDRETGDPLMTMTTSDFDDQNTDTYDKPTYSYDMPAYWNDKNMGGAYANYRMELNPVISTSGVVTVSNALALFQPGDEVYCATCTAGNKKLWISQVAASSFTLVKKDGIGYNGAGANYPLVVTRSGRRNLQEAIHANIVSTKQPNGPGINPIFAYFNQAIDGLTTNTPYDFTVPDCYDPSRVYSARLSVVSSNIVFAIVGCRDYDITIPVSATTIPQLNGYRLYDGLQPNTVYITTPANPNPTLVSYQGDLKGCNINTCMEGVLDASAVEYRSDFSGTNDYDGADLAAPTGLVGFAAGSKGVYRVVRTSAYFAMRKQSGDATSPLMYPTFTGEDGTYYSFIKFNHVAGNVANFQKDKGWRWASQVSNQAFTRDGKTLQSENPLGIPTGNLYGYNRNLVTATAVNASHREIGFESFEEHPTGTYSSANATGRILLQTTGTQTMNVVSTDAHTGNNSLLVSIPSGLTGLIMSLPVVSAIQNNSTDKNVQVVANKKYTLTFWVKTPNALNQNVVTVGAPAILPDINAGVNTIDGWRRIEQTFTAPASGTLSLSIAVFANRFFIDDIRLQPFNSEMKTMVYDPIKYVPRAELDGRNFATFYSYDEEGKPVIVKKETENGIVTVGHSRQNTKRTN